MVQNKPWTDEQAVELASLYNEGEGMPIADIAAQTGRSPKSVQGKLTHLGVYVKAEKPVARPKDDGPTKADIMSEIELAGLSTEGANGANKVFLAAVLAALST